MTRTDRLTLTMTTLEARAMDALEAALILPEPPIDDAPMKYWRDHMDYVRDLRYELDRTGAMMVAERNAPGRWDHVELALDR